jgi:hypothetical protein
MSSSMRRSFLRRFRSSSRRRVACGGSLDGGAHWLVPAMGLGGYRSAVAYSRETGDWIAVGPTGTDLSKDDGKNWTKVTGEAASGWNAISLPFAVGGNGKIGKLRDGVLP